MIIKYARMFTGFSTTQRQSICLPVLSVGGKVRDRGRGKGRDHLSGIPDLVLKTALLVYLSTAAATTTAVAAAAAAAAAAIIGAVNSVVPLVCQLWIEMI
jgi:hypothetical protein